MSRRPPRLARHVYTGLQAYFLTANTHQRRCVFRDGALARSVMAQLLESATRFDFALPAYCVMPDHVHVLFRARGLDGDFLGCAGRWRQVTAYAHKRASGQRLWQEGYWDRILRSDDDELCCAAYIVQNPVRAGLVATVADSPFLGSTEYTSQQLAEVPLDAQRTASARLKARPSAVRGDGLG